MLTKILLIGEKLVIFRAGLGLAQVGLALFAIGWARSATQNPWLVGQILGQALARPSPSNFFSKIKVCATKKITKVDHENYNINHFGNHCGYRNGNA